MHKYTRRTVTRTQNAIWLHFLPYLLNICRKFEFLITQGSVATCVRWGGYYQKAFIANFIRFPAVQNSENRLRFDKVRDSLKVGRFLRHSVYVRKSRPEIVWSKSGFPSLLFYHMLQWRNSTRHTLKKYPYIHEHFVTSFPYFNGTDSVYVCIHKLT